MKQTDEDKVTHMHDPNRKQTAYEIALVFYEEHQKLPSYRQLGEMAGVSKDTAGKAVRKLKERLKKTG